MLLEDAPSHSVRNEEDEFKWKTCDIDVCPHRYLSTNNLEGCTCPGIGQTVEDKLVYKCDSTHTTSVSPDVQINGMFLRYDIIINETIIFII